MYFHAFVCNEESADLTRNIFEVTLKTRDMQIMHLIVIKNLFIDVELNALYRRVNDKPYGNLDAEWLGSIHWNFHYFASKFKPRLRIGKRYPIT